MSTPRPRDPANEAWRTHLSAETQAPERAYRYPVPEHQTRETERQQDLDKRQREVESITAALDFPWRLALEFGCGSGANLALLKASAASRADSVVVGLDADSAQVDRARAVAAQLAPFDVSVHHATVEDLRSAPAELHADAVLCCQVLGHTSSPETAEIVAALLERVAPGGRAVLLFPVFLPAAWELGFAQEAPRGEDVCHLVRTDLAPDHPQFRQVVTSEAFDRLAADPPSGVLPVRGFYLEAWDGHARAVLPTPIPAPPATLRALIPGHFDVSGVAYSWHERGPESGDPAIGDVCITLRRQRE